MTLPRLACRDLHPFGVEVSLDLSLPTDDRVAGALRDLLREHELLLFRGQALSDADQTRVLQLFGPVLVEEGGHREISRGGNLGSGRLLFHSDLAFTSTPFRLLSLYALDVTAGTETWFASVTKAVERLPSSLHARLRDALVTNVIPPSQGERRVSHDVPRGVPQITQPAIVAHPLSGRPVTTMSEQQSARIEGLSAADSDALLDEAFDHLYAPANILRHSWRNGDLVIWDNIALQHARPDQAATPRRTLRRIAVAEKTFFELCPQFAPDDPRIAAWGVGGLLNLEPVSQTHELNRTGSPAEPLQVL